MDSWTAKTPEASHGSLEVSDDRVWIVLEVFVDDDFDFLILAQFRRQLLAREDDDGRNVSVVDTASQDFPAYKPRGAGDNDFHLMF